MTVSLAGTTPRHSAALVPALSVVVLTVAVLQTAVVPVLDDISAQLKVPEVTVSWAVTANLLAAAAAAPLIGRLADLRNKKHVLLGVLALVTAGSLLAATTAWLPLLLVGRVLQGLAFSLYPVAVSILRDEVPPEKMVRSMALISAMLGLGGGLGLVVTGLLMTSDGAPYQRVFWFCAIVTALVTIPAAIAIPDRPNRVDAGVDWWGGIGLSVGLSGVLLAVTRGRNWGWLSPATLGAAALGIVVLVAWWLRSRRIADPLISTAVLRHRPILLVNAATLMVGMGLYFSFLGLTDFVEAPRHDGYGFGASILVASVEFLLPGALAAAATALASGRLIERFGARNVITAGSLAGFAGFSFLVGWHTAPWQVITAGLLTNAYISLAYGALPVLIVQNVDEHETAVATGLNAVVRKIGSAISSAAVGMLLVPGADGHPPESGFAAIFALGAASAVGTILFIRMR
jgi:MFS family permease